MFFIICRIGNDTKCLQTMREGSQVQQNLMNEKALTSWRSSKWRRWASVQWECEHALLLISGLKSISRSKDALLGCGLLCLLFIPSLFLSTFNLFAHYVYLTRIFLLCLLKAKTKTLFQNPMQSESPHLGAIESAFWCVFVPARGGKQLSPRPQPEQLSYVKINESL